MIGIPLRDSSGSHRQNIVVIPFQRAELRINRDRGDDAFIEHAHHNILDESPMALVQIRFDGKHVI